MISLTQTYIHTDTLFCPLCITAWVISADLSSSSLIISLAMSSPLISLKTFFISYYVFIFISSISTYFFMKASPPDSDSSWKFHLYWNRPSVVMCCSFSITAFNILIIVTCLIIPTFIPCMRDFWILLLWNVFSCLLICLVIVCQKLGSLCRIINTEANTISALKKVCLGK
jgi:hypothetical protein